MTVMEVWTFCQLRFTRVALVIGFMRTAAPGLVGSTRNPYATRVSTNTMSRSVIPTRIGQSSTSGSFLIPPTVSTQESVLTETACLRRFKSTASTCQPRHLHLFKQRNAPIIRRSQFEMLLLMIFGGLFTTGAAVAYAGRPTPFLCGIRPVLVCMGFTTIFGSLFIKSLRVYQVFMRSAMKRVKVTLFRILKILSIFYVGDIIIFIAWYAADFPEPTITTKEASEFRGTVDRISCSSSSFIFTALLIFWKAILLLLGLCLSFLIRNVSVDFQETPWIFGSVVVVLVGCLVIMLMSYLVEMRASTYFVFLACGLLFCTILIMCLMLVPKAFRLNEVAASSSKTVVSIKSRQTNMNGMTNVTENDNTVDGSIDRPSQLKYQVKPLHNHNSSVNDQLM